MMLAVAKSIEVALSFLLIGWMVAYLKHPPE